MRRKQHEEESIYGLAANAPGRTAPQVVKYDAPAPAHAPKVKMHVDSSQVCASLRAFHAGSIPQPWRLGSTTFLICLNPCQLLKRTTWAPSIETSETASARRGP